MSWLLHVSLVTGLEQLVGEREMRLWHSVLVAEKQSSRQVARQMIHLRLEVLAAD